jgi:magnesium chelatase family protein
MLKDVLCAWEKQQTRYNDLDISLNAHLSPTNLDIYASITPEIQEFIQQTIVNLHLSPRAIHRIVRLSRTIADLA